MVKKLVVNQHTERTNAWVYTIIIAMYTAYISRVYWYTQICSHDCSTAKMFMYTVVPAWVRLDSCGLSLDGAVFRRWCAVIRMCTVGW